MAGKRKFSFNLLSEDALYFLPTPIQVNENVIALMKYVKISSSNLEVHPSKFIGDVIELGFKFDLDPQLIGEAE